MSVVAFGPQEAQINSGKAETFINIEKSILSYSHICLAVSPAEVDTHGDY